MTAPLDYSVYEGFFGFGRETTWDTPVVPGFWVPYQTPTWDPTEKWLPDNSLAGSPVMTRDLVPGVRYDKMGLKHYMYLDSIGNLLLAALGAADAVTGTGPYVHTLKLLNNAASQTPSYTLNYFDGSITRQMAGARLASMNITWSGDGTVDITSTFIGMPQTNPSEPSITPSTAHFVPGWGVTLSVGGTASATIVSGSIDITRVDTAAIFTATNQQAPHNIFSGPLQVKGKGKFLVESGDTTFSYANALGRDQQINVLTFTEPVSADTLALTMSAVQFTDPKPDTSKKWLLADCSFEAVADTTDAVTGISPLAAVLTNNQSGAY